MTIHIPPSWFVKQTRTYRNWCSVTECSECGLRAKYEDAHIVEPCPNCGGKMHQKVGRWLTTIPPIFFGIVRKERGVWQLKGENLA